MHVALLHNAISLPASSSSSASSANGIAQDELDVLVQVDAIRSVLQRAGHSTFVVPCTLNLQQVREVLNRESPQLVFNLVESLGGSDWLMFLLTGLLEADRWPYTGATSWSLVASGDKLAAKRRLRATGLPTPDWFSLESSEHAFLFQPGARVIVKAATEHASFALGDRSVVQVNSAASLRDRIQQCESASGRRHFAERFIDGREFNVSLLEIQGEVRVLPVAEIDFSGLPPARLPIVGYDAKWNEQSVEYHATPRRFDFPSRDDALLIQLGALALDCWRLFELCGYARVDFRVDELGRPWILELNANPCLAPDAGFAAAVNESGLTFDAAVLAMVESALPNAA